MPDIDLSSGHLLHLSVTYGYPAMIVLVVIASAGAPLPVSFLLIALGALSAAQGGPSFVALVVLGILASIAGDLADYTLGRIGGAPLLHWLDRWHRGKGASVFDRARERLRSRGSLMIVLSRFLFTPLAMPVSVLVGASSFTLPAFLLWDALGETIYVLGYLTLGRIFGAALTTEGPVETIFLVVGIAVALLPMFIGPGRMRRSSHSKAPSTPAPVLAVTAAQTSQSSQLASGAERRDTPDDPRPQLASPLP